MRLWAQDPLLQQQTDTKLQVEDPLHFYKIIFLERYLQNMINL